MARFKRMKATLCIVIFALLAASARAQTNLTDLLRQGILEEQADNTSTEAASLASRIFGIESLTNTIEQARAVAAVFPEDSADLQKMLMRLPMLQEQESWLEKHPQPNYDEFNRTRRFVLAIGGAEGLPAAALPGGPQLQNTNLLAGAQLELQKELAYIRQQVDFILGLQKAQLKALQAAPGTQTAQQAVQSPNVWEKVKDLPEPELETVLPTLVPDSALTSLLQQRNTAETGLTQKRTLFFSEANPEVLAQKAELSAINQQISNRVSGIMEALKILNAVTASSETSIPQNGEDQEIARIQEMAQNSPDLINAPGDDGRSPLVDAAAKGQLKVAAFLLDHGADVNAGGKDGPPLVAAAKAGQRTMVELLLEHGADVNIGSGAALEAAIEHGYEAVAETLLMAYADVNVENDVGQTPLILAAMGGNTKVIEMLLDAGANPNIADHDGVTPLSSAALANSPPDLAPLKLLLSAKADPNGGGRNAPLLCAINNRNTTSAELLLQAGANPNSKGLIDGNLGNLGRDGYDYATPLWMAVNINDAPMVQLLLKYNADPNSSQINKTPVIFSAMDNASILQALLNAGANPNVTNDNGRTPLSFATEKDSPEAIKLLLSARADPNGGTLDAPLLRAIDSHDLASAESLLQAGADPNAEGTMRCPRGSWGSRFYAGFSAIARSVTPLWLAIDTHQFPMVQLLLKYSANPNDSRIGHSPIIFFALSDTNILQALLDGGANPNVRNDDDKTPLTIVEDVVSGDPDVASNACRPTENDSCFDRDLLREHGALEVLPDWDHIIVSRPGTKYSVTIFERGTNDWNQFTLYGLLGVQYGLLTTSVRPNWSQDSWTYNLNPVNNGLAFPDFSRIVILRPQPRGTNWTDLKIDLAQALDSGDYAADVPLKFGDIVEIPESNHVFNAQWTGLTTNQLLTLAHSLTRHLQISVNGTTTKFTVGPRVDVGSAWHSQFSSYEVPALVQLTLQGFMLWPVLEESQLLLATSDLSRVLVKRRDATTGQICEWTVDCSDPNSAPYFWLRDGDMIEVPEAK